MTDNAQTKDTSVTWALVALTFLMAALNVGGFTAIPWFLVFLPILIPVIVGMGFVVLLFVAIMVKAISDTR
jgi:hypothetical protein